LAQGLETGRQEPHFSLLTAGSGRRVDLEGVAGRKVVLIFHLQGTAPTVRGIGVASSAVTTVRGTRDADILVPDEGSNVAASYQGKGPSRQYWG
jgi:hypothetical protein